MIKLSSPLRAVIFDLDETLIHSKIDFKKMKFEIISFLQYMGVTPGLLNDRMLNVEITRVAVENLRGKGLFHLFFEDFQEVFSAHS